MGQPIERALRQDRIVKERNPLLDGPIRGHDGRCAPMAHNDHLVEIARLLRGEPAQPKVVDDQKVGGEEAPEDAVGGVVGAGLVNPIEEVVTPEEEHALAGAIRGVPEGGGERGLAYARGAE